MTASAVASNRLSRAVNDAIYRTPISDTRSSAFGDSSELFAEDRADAGSAVSARGRIGATTVGRSQPRPIS